MMIYLVLFLIVFVLRNWYSFLDVKWVLICRIIFGFNVLCVFGFINT